MREESANREEPRGKQSLLFSNVAYHPARSPVDRRYPVLAKALLVSPVHEDSGFEEAMDTLE